MSDELLLLIQFLEEQFYLQWKQDNYPHPIFQFLDGSYDPIEGDTGNFLEALIQKASEETGDWGDYDPSELEDFVSDFRDPFFKTLAILENEIARRGLKPLTVAIN